MGAGVLLEPLLRRVNSEKAAIVCVDSDARAVAELRQTLQANPQTKADVVLADFLEWSAPGRGAKGRQFDCIVMNPPFSAKKRQLMKLEINTEMPGAGQADIARFIPVEGAFVVRAVGLLRKIGRLLAVLPGSVIQSESTRWLREYLKDAGAVRYVRELPRRTFRDVESRFYLLVFEKAGRGRPVVLCNHDLAGKERLRIRQSAWGPNLRLDYAYQMGRRFMDGLSQETGMNWCRLADVADVFRGSETSPDGIEYAVHSCDLRTGFWRRSQRHRNPSGIVADLTVQRGDILVKRVARDCSQSFGKCVGLRGLVCTDCLIIVRPKHSRSSSRILFALRCLAGMDAVRGLVESGTGAAYIKKTDLSGLTIPLGLSKRFPGLFDSYRAALSSRRFDLMAVIEKRAQGLLRKIGERMLEKAK